ncbi:hypothetical protein [Alteribacter natronophilus]|uniref:hypothetical protein n=1 Tax=Alteribacter natronophilus TaxID=2583810 RepID=UPI00110EC723|nr:hypothetical protein [Alteribacter natronophilus]TMW71066.1 hypothetical protein FGB90_13945 [Alteribacter natronophilus]
MDKRRSAFLHNGFTVTKETKKAVEFEHKVSGQVIYLFPNVTATIVLDPAAVEGDSSLKEKSDGLTHHTSLLRFPEKMHTGKTPITYGYSYKFKSEGDLWEFLLELSS